MVAILRLTAPEKIALDMLKEDTWISAFDSDIPLPMLNTLVAKGVAERKKTGPCLESPLTALKFRLTTEIGPADKRVLRRRAKKISNMEAYAIADKLMGRELKGKRRKLKRRKK